MMRCVRGEEPTVLVAKGPGWTAAYQAKLAEDPAQQFRWPTHERESLNQILLPALESMTLRHCSYCDGFPLGSMARQTIDHFRPKHAQAFPQLAFAWSNLFLACDVCQREKGHDFKAEWLKPDELDYAFERYFVFNFRTGEIEANPAATSDEQACANRTIDGFGLNRANRPGDRKRVLNQYADHVQLDERAYRFMFDV
jgi:uncharacterized protein (TIGR02646 family)